jgi:predicted S18 family serine protease
MTIGREKLGTKDMGVASLQIEAARRSSAKIFLSETGHDHGDVRYGRKSHVSSILVSPS